MTTPNTSVSSNVRVLLSEALINYLWKLALSDENRQNTGQTFILEPAKLGGREVQDIFHSDDCRRVFGVEPVRCKLRILNSNGGYQMTLIS